MPYSDFGSVGTDVTIDIFDPQDGNIVSVRGITSFNPRPINRDIESHPLSGEDGFATIYLGWEFTMDYDRKDGQIDAYFASREARYRAREVMQTITITQTITEADGRISQYKFTRCEIKQDDTGTWNREDKVSGRITGRGTRTKVI